MDFKMGIHSGNQSLSRRFFISCGSVDLTGKIKILYILQFKSWLELGRIEIVILDSISRTEYLGIFKTFDMMKGFHLNIERKRRRESLKIIFVRSPTLRFKEKLMFCLVCKGPQFIFNARTVTRSDTRNHSREKRRVSESASQYVMNFLIGMNHKTWHLRSSVLGSREERKI